MPETEPEQEEPIRYIVRILLPSEPPIVEQFAAKDKGLALKVASQHIAAAVINEVPFAVKLIDVMDQVLLMAATSGPEVEDTDYCRVCGCSEDDPCPMGCAWVKVGLDEAALCTRCA